MKNIKILETENDRIKFLTDQIRTQAFRDAIPKVPFLKKILFEFCKHPRIVFEATDPKVERGNFTSWYNALSIRDYENPAITDLFYLHEIAHIVTMPYLMSMDFGIWKKKIFKNELEASVISEAYIYFLIPELRKLSFNNEIWVDRFLKNGHLASTTEYKTLLVERQNILTKPNLKDTQEIRIFDYQKQNEAWAEIWSTKFHLVESHMFEFYQLSLLDSKKAGHIHLKWLETEISSGGKRYPFAQQVEAFSDYNDKSYKSHDGSDKSIVLKNKVAS